MSNKKMNMYNIFSCLESDKRCLSNSLGAALFFSAVAVLSDPLLSTSGANKTVATKTTQTVVDASKAKVASQSGHHFSLKTLGLHKMHNGVLATMNYLHLPAGQVSYYAVVGGALTLSLAAVYGIYKLVQYLMKKEEGDALESPVAVGADVVISGGSVAVKSFEYVINSVYVGFCNYFSRAKSVVSEISTALTDASRHFSSIKTVDESNKSSVAYAFSCVQKAVSSILIERYSNNDKVLAKDAATKDVIGFFVKMTGLSGFVTTESLKSCLGDKIVISLSTPRYAYFAGGKDVGIAKIMTAYMEYKMASIKRKVEQSESEKADIESIGEIVSKSNVDTLDGLCKMIDALADSKFMSLVGLKSKREFILEVVKVLCIADDKFWDSAQDVVGTTELNKIIADGISCWDPKNAPVFGSDKDKKNDENVKSGDSHGAGDVSKIASELKRGSA